jgi:hypothetical protein
MVSLNCVCNIYLSFPPGKVLLSESRLSVLLDSFPDDLCAGSV